MSFSFIDSHVHFWDQQNLPYPWLSDVPTIAGRHTPAELRAEARADHPSRIVFVQVGAPWLEEVKWIEHLALSEPRIAGIVACLAVNQGRTTTESIRELKKHPLVRGVRHLIQDESEPDYCLQPNFLAGIQELVAAGLSFDVCCREHQLPFVIQLIRLCPEVRFILDHAGKPNIRRGTLDSWPEYIRTLATLPNLDCKFSGLMTEANWSNWTTETLRPFVDQLFEHFGPHRLLFGSDWPVAKLAGSYQRWLATARELTAHFTAAEQSAIFTDNARRVYRLD